MSSRTSTANYGRVFTNSSVPWLNNRIAVHAHAKGLPRTLQRKTSQVAQLPTDQYHPLPRSLPAPCPPKRSERNNCSVISASVSRCCTDYARCKERENERSSADPHDPLRPSLFRRQDHPRNACLAHEFSEKASENMNRFVQNCLHRQAGRPRQHFPRRRPNELQPNEKIG